jgi:hypothetical protein
MAMSQNFIDADRGQLASLLDGVHLTMIKTASPPGSWNWTAVRASLSAPVIVSLIPTSKTVSDESFVMGEHPLIVGFIKFSRSVLHVTMHYLSASALNQYRFQAMKFVVLKNG